jgi:bacterioferritin-associated ferredoxin
MYICLCNAITDRDFLAHAVEKDCTVSTLYRSLGIKPRCGRCVPYVKQLLLRAVEIPHPQAEAAATA